MKNNKKEIQDELEKIAPSLSKLKKEEVFDVPENYFSQLPDQILNEIDFFKTERVPDPVSSSRSSSWLAQLADRLNIFFQPRIAVGFAMMILLAVASIFILNNENASSNEMADLTSAELENYVKANIDDFEADELMNVLGDDGTGNWTEIEIEDEDLNEYLEEIIDDIDASDLEDFL